MSGVTSWFHLHMIFSFRDLGVEHECHLLKPGFFKDIKVDLSKLSCDIWGSYPERVAKDFHVLVAVQKLGILTITGLSRKKGEGFDPQLPSSLQVKLPAMFL